MAEIKKVYKNWTAYDVLNSDTVGSALTAGTGIGISSNTISNTWVTSVNGSTWAVTVQDTLVSWTNIKTVNWNSLLGSGDLEVWWITKIFTLSSTSDTTTAQAAYDWWANGGNPVLRLTWSSASWTFFSGSSSEMIFSYARWYWATSSWNWSRISNVTFTLSWSSVTNIWISSNYIRIGTSAPTSWSNNIITLVI